jgi:hypothetical protein
LYSTSITYAKRDNKRKASSNTKKIRNSSKKRTLSTQATDKKNTESDTKNTKIDEEIEVVENAITEDNCEFNYNLCMNKICADNSIGKCVCYEDKYTNLHPKFKTINGNKVKYGFELFEYAKKQCLYILDQCMQTRRSVTEKYKNLVQRDCLMTSEIEVAKGQGLSAELDKLKECLYNHCTATGIDGNENFAVPKYGLCFDPDVAKYQLDANCISVIANSSQPTGLRELFMNEMAKKREEACINMKGELSSDRQKCYILVSYGKNKDEIAASKKIAVGDFFTCNGTEFDANLSVTDTYHRKSRHIAAKIASANLRAAGNIVGTVLGEDQSAKFVDQGIDLAGTIVNVAIDVNKIKEGKLSKEAGMQSIMNELNLPSVITTAISRSISASIKANEKVDDSITIKRGRGSGGGCGQGDGVDDYIKITRASNVIAGGSGGGCAPASLPSKKEKTNTPPPGGCAAAAKAGAASKAATALSIVTDGINAVTAITEGAFDAVEMQLTVEEEKKGIIKHAEIDRASGTGAVKGDTLTTKGNCFINDEWFASENETILLEWQN